VGLGLPIALACAFIVLDIFARTYRWIRGLLGEVEPDPIPAARIETTYRQRGFRHEPTWLRPLQATMLATGLTVALVSVLGIVVVAACAAFV
jgi:hypothetical protein